MKLAQKGFAALPLLLIVFIATALVGVGWYVWTNNNQQAKITNFEECVAAGNPVMESYPEQCSANGQTFTKNTVNLDKPEPSVKTKDWNTYRGLGLTLKYPKDWKQDKTQGDDPKLWAHFISPDYVPVTELGPSVKAGYWLELRVDGTDELQFSSYDEHLNALQSNENPCGGSYSTSNIDGLPAIISDQKCHGTDITATVYKSSKEFFFRLNSLDEDSKETRELFADILSSITLD